MLAKLICSNITKHYVVLEDANGNEIQNKEVMNIEEAEDIINKLYFKALMINCNLSYKKKEVLIEEDFVNIENIY